MFEGQAFESWLLILLGAAAFGILFGIAASMGEALLDGTPRLTRATVGIALGAFIGYIGVAFLVRREGGA